MLSFFSAEEDHEHISGKRLALSLGAGLLAASAVLCFYLIFFANPSRSAGMAIVLSVAGVFATLVTGPWAVVQILFGVRGSYYALVTIIGLLLYVALVYAQIKYLPRRFLVFLAGTDVFILILMLGWAYVVVW